MSKNTVVRFVKTAWATFAWSSVSRPRTGRFAPLGEPMRGSASLADKRAPARRQVEDGSRARTAARAPHHAAAIGQDVKVVNE